MSGRHSHRRLLFALPVAHALALAFIAVLAAPPGDNSGPGIGRAMGIAYAQAALLAVLATQAPLSLGRRLLLGWCGTALSLLAVVVYVLRTGGAPTVALLAAAALILAQLLIQLPLWFARWWGYRLMVSTDAEPPGVRLATDRVLQFGLLELLVLFLLIALPLGFGRWLATTQAFGPGVPANIWLAFFLVLTLFSTILSIPAVLTCLALRWASLAILLMGLYGLAVWRLEIVVVGGTLLTPEFLFDQNASLLIWLAGSLLIVRIGGLHWRRVH